MIPLDWHVNSNYADAEAMLGPLATACDGTSPFGLQQQLQDVLTVVPGEFELNADDTISMGGRSPLAPAAFAVHLGERIFVYPLGFVAIVQLNGEFGLFRFYKD